MALHRAGQTHAECLHSRASTAGCGNELLNETLFTSLLQARVALRCWRADYNDARHTRNSDGGRLPSFAFSFDPRRDLALRYCRGLRASSVAPTAQQGNSNATSELRTG